MTITYTHWRKSSYSGGENNDCVEIAGTLDAIRDSKNHLSPTLHVNVPDLITAARESRFDR